MDVRAFQCINSDSSKSNSPIMINNRVVETLTTEEDVLWCEFSNYVLNREAR
jgi:cell division protein ZapE